MGADKLDIFCQKNSQKFVLLSRNLSEVNFNLRHIFYKILGGLVI